MIYEWLTSSILIPALNCRWWQRAGTRLPLPPHIVLFRPSAVLNALSSLLLPTTAKTSRFRLDCVSRATGTFHFIYSLRIKCLENLILKLVTPSTGKSPRKRAAAATGGKRNLFRLSFYQMQKERPMYTRPPSTNLVCAVGTKGFDARQGQMLVPYFEWKSFSDYHFIKKLLSVAEGVDTDIGSRDCVGECLCHRNNHWVAIFQRLKKCWHHFRLYTLKPNLGVWLILHGFWGSNIHIVLLYSLSTDAIMHDRYIEVI